MSIAVSVTHRQGDFSLDVAFATQARMVALFGPSGSGKTTVLNIIAGLVRPKAARVIVQERALTDTARGIFVPTHKRRIGYVFQEGRLFPHLTVRRNLTYGRWFTPPAEHWAKLDEVVALLGVGPPSTAPRARSRGARSSASRSAAPSSPPRACCSWTSRSPRLTRSVSARRCRIERLRDKLAIPIVYVSHSLAEVERLTDEVVRLEGGRLAPALNRSRERATLGS